jgi:hypothetical protein
MEFFTGQLGNIWSLCTGMYCMPISPKAPTFGAGAKNRLCTRMYCMPILQEQKIGNAAIAEKDN